MQGRLARRWSPSSGRMHKSPRLLAYRPPPFQNPFFPGSRFWNPKGKKYSPHTFVECPGNGIFGLKRPFIRDSATNSYVPAVLCNYMFEPPRPSLSGVPQALREAQP